MENSKTATAFAIGLLVLHVSSDFTVQAAEGDCGDSEYRDTQGKCQSCHSRACQPGEKVPVDCKDGPVLCEPCTDLEPGTTCASGISARKCISCKDDNKKQVQACDADSDSVCEGCLDNYYPTVVGNRVYCFHCQEDKKNRSECRRSEPPTIQDIIGEDPDAPLPPGAEITKEKDTKSQDVFTPVLITAISSVTIVAILCVFAVVWKKIKIYRGRVYEQTARDDVESARGPRQESEGNDESPSEEEERAVCRIEGSKRVRFHSHLKRQLSSSSTKSEDEEKLLEPTSTSKTKHHRPPRLKPLQRSSGVSEVDVHCAGPPSAHGVDAAPFPTDGTPPPFAVEEAEEDPFPHGTEITGAAAEQRHEPGPETPVPAAGINMPPARQEFKDLSGQTAKLHSANTARNNTANEYHTNLALCTKHADTIRLEDEWFNFEIKQKLSVFLDKNQPIPSMPTWRTFFEKFKLTKHELDAADNKSVASPTIALFDKLQSQNPGAENCFTVGDVLRQLNKMKFIDAANALCDELLEHMEQTQV